MRPRSRIRGLAALCAAVLAGSLAACSGSSDGAANGGAGNPPSGNGPPEVVQGVATPSSVAVVTATNAE